MTAVRDELLRRVGMYGVVVQVLGILLVTKVVGFLKDRVLATSVGLGDPLDAYLFAFAIPGFLMTVVGISLATAFVPRFVVLRSAEPAAAHGALRTVLLVGSVGTVALAAVLALLGGSLVELLAPSFGPVKRHDAVLALAWMAPIVVLSCLSTTLSGTLNACGRQRMTSVVAAVAPGVVLIGALLATQALDAVLIARLTTFGFALELVVVVALARASGLLPLGALGGGASAEQLAPVLHGFLALAASAAILSATNLVGQVVAAPFGSGAIATLSYGAKVPMLAVGLAVAALSAMFLPRFSQLLAAGERTRFVREVRREVALTAAVSAAVAAIVVWQSEAIVRLLFGGGRMTPSAVAAVAAVQDLYVLQLPVHVGGIVLARALNAMQHNAVFVWIAAASLAVNVGLSVLLSAVVGLPGIALAHTATYAVSGTLMWFAFNSRVARAGWVA